MGWDFIKEVHGVLHHHLAEDTPRGLRLNPKWDSLKSDMTRLVLHAINVGEMKANRSVLEIIETNHRSILQVFREKDRKFRNEMSVYIKVEQFTEEEK